MKIAVVGSGVSGLVAAYRLAGRGHWVTLFEAQDRLGGHAHTVDLEIEGRRHAVDVGFIVFNPMTYPHFCALLEELEIDSQPADMGFSVHSEIDGVEYGSHTLRSLFAQPRNALRAFFWRMLRGIHRFNREAETILERTDTKIALGSYLEAAGYDDAFVRMYIVPLGSSIWSATPERILEFPAREFVSFLSNHGLLQARPEKRWRTLTGGSRRYVAAISQGFEVRSGTPVDHVKPGVQGVDLAVGRRVERFDRAVLASHAPEALRLLHDPSAIERAILGAIPYQRNDAVLHGDVAQLPARRAAHKSWNYRIPTQAGARLSITYDMNRLQSLGAAQPILVTLNPSTSLDPGSIHRRLSFDHPVFTERGFAAQRQHAAIDGARGVHFCGAYWGFGFHEDGVRSALRVVDRIDGARRE